MNYPVKKKLFDERIARIKKYAKENSPMLRIAPIAKMECQLVVEAYYGGRFRAVWAMFKEAVYLWRHEKHHMLLIWISDKVGWTKLYHMPETLTHHEYWHRHGYKCSGSPNCSDMKCIDKSVPKWFRVLSGWDKLSS